VPRVVDPLGGSPYVEALTDELEAAAEALIARVDQQGGAIAAIERGFIEREILGSARAAQDRIESGASVVVGVNRFTEAEPLELRVLKVDEALRDECIRQVTEHRARRDQRRAGLARKTLVDAARGRDNVMPPLIECVIAGVTLGEICSELEGIFGKHKPA